MEDIHCFLSLLQVRGLGPVKGNQLLQYFSTVQDIFTSSRASLEQCPILNEKLIHEIERVKAQYCPDRELEWMEKNHVQTLLPGSKAYPDELEGHSDSPLALFLIGDRKLLSSFSISVVGTRVASRYGLDMAFSVSKNLAAQGVVVISGLARGVDTQAHLGALQAGKTVAILGSGFAHLYPKENIELAKVIAERGALLTESPVFTPPDRFSFPKRNRLIARLSKGCILCEAPKKSGAMITMDLAKKMGKKTFCFPGRADQDSFAGNHLLLKNSTAKYVIDCEDVLSAFEELPRIEKKTEGAKKSPSSLCSSDEKVFLDKLPETEFTVDEAVRYLQLPTQKVLPLLMRWGLKKVVKEYPGKVYKKMKDC